MSTRTLRERNREATYEDLLRAAESVLIREGYENVKMRDIAAEAGCSSATLYKYFRDKEHLLHEIIGRHIAELADTIHARWQATDDPIKRMQIDIRCGLESHDRNRTIMNLIREQLPPPPPGGPMPHSTGAFHERLQAFEREIIANLEVAQAQGRIRTDIPAPLLRHLFIRLVMSGLELLHTDKDAPLTEALHRTIWSLVAGALQIREEWS